jgi:nucleoside diphosphate kinase
MAYSEPRLVRSSQGLSKGFVLKGLKLFQTPEELAQAWEGPGVVASAQKLIGVTNPLQAEPGTIRDDFGIEVGG